MAGASPATYLRIMPPHRDPDFPGEHHALVVEDSPFHRERLVELVARTLSGFAVSQAQDVSSAIASARRLRPEVVTLDLGLPDGSGLDVLRAIREDGAPARVIVVTGNADEGYRKASLEAGADAFLDKAQLHRLPALLAPPDEE
jgi:DNA-binding response OmpR family regulator